MPTGGFSSAVVGKDRATKTDSTEFPPGLHENAKTYYSECIRRQRETGYYCEADENLRIRYANELVFFDALQAQAQAGGYAALVQTSESGYEQRSALAMHLQASKENLQKYEAQLMLTPYQRKKGNTQGVHKKPESAESPKTMDELLEDET